MSELDKLIDMVENWEMEVQPAKEELVDLRKSYTKMREHAGVLVAYLAEEERDYKLRGKPENHIWLHVEALKKLLEVQP